MGSWIGVKFITDKEWRKLFPAHQRKDSEIKRKAVKSGRPRKIKSRTLYPVKKYPKLDGRK